jgi:hypothetical protein
MEEGLLGRVAPIDQFSSPPGEKLANAAICGALIVHVLAGEHPSHIHPLHTRFADTTDTDILAIFSFVAAFFLTRFELQQAAKPGSGIPPQLVIVGFFHNKGPPIHLLRRCHTICIWLTVSGFVLALISIMAFVWDKMPLAVSIFSSVCMGSCLVFGFIAVVLV